jgi:hypothetical protein
MAYILETGNPYFPLRKHLIHHITKTRIFCGDRGQYAFTKPSELKDGVTLERYPRVRFDMCTFTYKEAK